MAATLHLRSTTSVVRFVGSNRYRQNPYPAYQRLRSDAPILRTPLGVWILTGHAEVNDALRSPALSSSDAHIDPTRLHLGPLRWVLRRKTTEEGPFFDRSPGLMLFQDPPDHTRLRRLVGRSFTQRRVSDLEERIAAIAGDLIDKFAGSDHFELMSQFAYPFPARVICELIGVPSCDTERIIAHAPGLAAGLDPGPLLTTEAKRAANASMEAIVEYLDRLIAERRRNPGDDLVSALFGAPAGSSEPSDHGQDLSDDEIIDMVLLLLIAGHETTANLFGNGFAALLDDPEALADLRAAPSITDAAVDELLRIDSPVQMTMRFATRPTQVAGHDVEAGSVLLCCLGAANHDPSVFADPERIRWDRAANPHLSFGGGIHHCLGAPLARSEARIGLELLLERFEHLTAAEPVRRRNSFAIRALERLNLATC